MGCYIVSKGNNLARARVFRGKTITELGKMAGVAYTVICRAECGFSLKPASALKLCAALECEFDDLFTLERRGQVADAKSET